MVDIRYIYMTSMFVLRRTLVIHSFEWHLAWQPHFRVGKSFELYRILDCGQTLPGKLWKASHMTATIKRESFEWHLAWQQQQPSNQGNFKRHLTWQLPLEKGRFGLYLAWQPPSDQANFERHLAWQPPLEKERFGWHLLAWQQPSDQVTFEWCRVSNDSYLSNGKLWMAAYMTATSWKERLELGHIIHGSQISRRGKVWLVPHPRR